MGKKLTSSTAASNAAKTLRRADASTVEKSVAGSTLSQSKHGERVTSERVASSAGQVLRDPAEPKEARSAAGSALAQRET